MSWALDEFFASVEEEFGVSIEDTEQLDTPAAVLVNEGFGFDARSAASGKGMPGVRVVPETVEFWQGGADRLHDRLRFVLDDAEGGGWIVQRLTPGAYAVLSLVPNPRTHVPDAARGMITSLTVR